MGADVKLIEDNSLHVENGGYEFLVRLNWYRSLPASSVSILHLTLDGQPVETERIRFEVNNHLFRLDELRDQVEEFWFVQDSAHVHVLDPGKIQAGETHSLEADIALRIPYISIGEGKFLTNVTHAATTQGAR